MPEINFTLTGDSNPAPRPPSVDPQAQAETHAWILDQAAQGPLVVEWGGAPWGTVVSLNGRAFCVTRLVLTCDPSGHNTIAFDADNDLHLEADFTADGMQNVGRTEIGITALRGLHASV